MRKSSAKRRGRTVKKSSKIKKTKRFRYLILLILFGIIGMYFLKPKQWDGHSNYSIVYPNKEGGVNVSVFDPLGGEITTIIIPNNLEVESAQGLGIWKIGSIWELGEKEDMGGLLLAETVTKHLKFPVRYWIDGVGSGYTNGKLSKIIPSLIYSNTNISLRDRLRIALFSLSVSNPDKSEIDLARTTYLRPRILADDTEGYVINSRIPQSIASIFTDQAMSERVIRAEIKDNTGIGASDGVGELLEVMGVKVASVERIGVVDLEKGDCLVGATEPKLAKKVAFVLGCEVAGIAPSNFDLVVSLSEGFGERY